MNPKLKRLLNRKRLKGKELGIILVSDLVLFFRSLSEGEEYKTILDDDFYTNVQFLDRTQKRIYDRYKELHDWINIYYNTTQSYFRNAQFRTECLSSYTRGVAVIEEINFYLDNLPLIMTPEYYEQAIKSNDDDVLSRHIAVLQPSNKGMYIPPELSTTIFERSLYGFFKENPARKKNEENITDSREILKDCYLFVLRYNEVIKQITEQWEIPDFEVFKYPIEMLKGNVESINSANLAIQTAMKKSRKQDYKIRKRKLGILNKFFGPIEIENWTVSNKERIYLKWLISNQDCFNERVRIDRLCRGEIDDLMRELLKKNEEQKQEQEQ